MGELIDTTEMYLKSIMELLEEGVVPMRARIAERLGQSGPTVSQTVARMERDGLLRVRPDRHLELTAEGERLGLQVMRKHRLVERLLMDVIGLEWHLVHEEACRWEHVVSDLVESRLAGLLDGDPLDPFGNLIPGLEELGHRHASSWRAGEPVSLAQVAEQVCAQGRASARVRVARISEILQADADLLADLAGARLRPGDQAVVHVDADGQHVRIVGCEEDGAVQGGNGSEHDGAGTAQDAGLTLPPEDQRYFFVQDVQPQD